MTDDKLINYKIDQLTRVVKEEFTKVNEHLEKQDVRVNDLYIWRAGIETKTTMPGNTLSGKDLGKIVLATIALATLALTIVSRLAE